MKYIGVSCCMECPWIREESFCGITYYSPKDLSAIPDWCPLPDAEDVEKLKAEVQRLEHQNTQLRDHIERMRFDAGRRG